jgi:hypothetical protein
MNLRERKLVLVIGGLVGLWAAWKAVDLLLISPMATARKQIATHEEEYRKARAKRDELPVLAKEWQGITARCYSFDGREVQTRFDDQIKQLAAKHGLTKTNTSPLSPGKLPNKSDVGTVSVRFTGEGSLKQVSEFLADIYRLPVLCVIRKLRLAPLKSVGGGDEIRIHELLVETLVPPEMTPQNTMEPVAVRLRGTTTMPADPAEAPPSLRRGLPTEAEYTQLAERNIFKAYEPPPQFAITIDNQDLKDVTVDVKFTWKGAPGPTQPAATVAGKSRKELPPGAGDKAEVLVRYADGTTFGPTPLTWAEGRPAVVTVPAHTPPPPPESFLYSIKNEGDEPVELEAVITKDGKPMTLPIMKIPAKTPQPVALPELKGQSLMLTAIYSDGTRAAPGSYQVATQNTGVHVIPPKPKHPVKPPPAVVAQLPPPNPDLKVTALLTYPESQEMIAVNLKTSPPKREIIPRGAPIDGGTLVAVTPLGGVAQIGGAYFLYPLGRKFPERVQLDAAHEDEIPDALVRWNQQ